jgi:hypothetical protein
VDSDTAKPQLRRALGLADTALMIVAALTVVRVVQTITRMGDDCVVSRGYPEDQKNSLVAAILQKFILKITEILVETGPCRIFAIKPYVYQCFMR